MPWFAFDIESYDADTMHLSACEDGIYGRLLRFYYTTRMPLPDNDRALASIARVTLPEWEAVKTTIRAFFKSRRGKLTHKRCDAELDRQDRSAKSRSQHAQKASHARSSYINKLRSTRSARDVPETKPVDLKRSTRQDKTREKEESPPSPQGEEVISGTNGHDQTDEFENWWQHVPKKSGRGQAEKAYRLARKVADAATLLGGIVRYAGERAGQEARFTKNPSTWLNGKCWLDEPVEPEIKGLYGGAMM